MPRIATRFALLVGLFSLSLPACEGKGAPGGPFEPAEFSTAIAGDGAASLASTCADYCSHQSDCGAEDLGCSDDCQHGDVAQQYSSQPELDEPVPEACADAYVDAIDCLATPACDEMTVACETEVAAYVGCKVDAIE